MSDISSFWMFLPFTLMGIGEILVNPALMHYSYVQAPEGLRSSVQAFNLVAAGAISNIFTSALSDAMIPENLNDGHIEYFYYANAVCALLGIVIYIVLFGVNDE